MLKAVAKITNRSSGVFIMLHTIVRRMLCVGFVPCKSQIRVTQFLDTIKLHFLLRISAIEQETTEVLRTHPFLMVGYAEVVNRKLYCLRLTFISVICSLTHL